MVTKDLPFLNIRVDKIEVYKAILDVSELVDKSYEGVNNADLEEIDTFLDQEVFYYCKQPKVVSNFYATKPKNGNMWYPELQDCKMELDEYPLEEEYDDQLHRELLTRGDTETMKTWLEQEAMFRPKLQCDTCKDKKYENSNLLNNSSSIEEKEQYEKLGQNVEVES